MTSRGKKILTKDRIKLLNDFNFIWDVRACIWKIRLNELKQYQKTHGHCIVPASYQCLPKLRVWVEEARKRKRTHQNGIIPNHRTVPLTVKQHLQLCELNFVWEVQESIWLEHFYKLQLFIKQHGHSQVPFSYTDKSLAIWVKEQRSDFRIYQSSNN